MSTIAILLATYQGEKYLESQLLSIFNQSYYDFHLWIRDDGSTDSTKEILKKWKENYPEKITIVENRGEKGAKNNFSALMHTVYCNSQAPYIMFADQDDHWFPNKLELAYLEIKKLENQYSKEHPLLIHTDLEVVSSALQPIASSFLKYSGLNPKHIALNRLLTQNTLTGCTFLFNRALLEKSLPISSNAVMHDWWMGLVATCFGTISFLPKATLLYRQHEKNDIGAKPYRLLSYIQTCFSTKKKSIDPTFKQAHYFLEQYYSQLTKEQKEILFMYSQLPTLSFLQQKKVIFKYKFFKQGIGRNIKMFFTSYFST